MSFLDWIFPARCVGCSKNESYLCNNCRGKIFLYEGLLSDKFYDGNYLDEVFAISYDNNRILRALVMKYKYSYCRGLSLLLSDFFISFFNGSELMNEKYKIVSTPSFKKRKKDRGFDSMERILSKVSDDCSFDVFSGISISKDVSRQQTLNRSDRLKNLKDVFFISDKISGDYIILDDVLTTGATISEVAKVLKCAGARRVVAVVLIKA